MEPQNVSLTSLFHQALVNPTDLTREDFDMLLSKYPYSQPLHFAYERKKMMEGEAGDVSAIAILLARNPTWLQEYIRKPIQAVPEIEPENDDYVPFEELENRQDQEEALTETESTADRIEEVENLLEEVGLEADAIETVEESQSLETLMNEAIGGGDYFMLHANEDTHLEPAEEDAIVTHEPEEENVSLYNDELMPYSFRWWLHKTRLEHADTYQPFASPTLPTTNKAPFDASKLDEIALDQQIRDNIIRQQDPEDKLSEEVKQKDVQYTRVDKTSELIERFIREEPQIQPPLPDQLTMENKARKSSEEQFNLVTETLANIYADQAMYVKAIEVYKKLILKFPEKKSYFATQIKNLEEKLY